MTEQETEIMLLRVVYEHARSLLRYNGIDKARTLKAADDLDDAVEQVKAFDAGSFDKEK